MGINRIEFLLGCLLTLGLGVFSYLVWNFYLFPDVWGEEMPLWVDYSLTAVMTVCTLSFIYLFIARSAGIFGSLLKATPFILIMVFLLAASFFDYTRGEFYIGPSFVPLFQYLIPLYPSLVLFVVPSKPTSPKLAFNPYKQDLESLLNSKSHRFSLDLGDGGFLTTLLSFYLIVFMGSWAAMGLMSFFLLVVDGYGFLQADRWDQWLYVLTQFPVALLIIPIVMVPGSLIGRLLLRREFFEDFALAGILVVIAAHLHRYAFYILRVGSGN